MGRRDSWGDGMSPGLVAAWQFALSRADQETGGRVGTPSSDVVDAGGQRRREEVLNGLGVDIDSLSAGLRPAVDVPKPGTAGDPLHFGTAHLLLGLLRHGALGVVTVNMARAEIRRQMAEFLSGRVPPMNPARADELISTPRVRLPDSLREAIARIRDLHREKELAIDAGDHGRAQRARADLQEAMRVKHELEAAWRPTVDVVSVVEEVEALRTEVDRLRARLNDTV